MKNYDDTINYVDGFKIHHDCFFYLGIDEKYADSFQKYFTGECNKSLFNVNDSFGIHNAITDSIAEFTFKGLIDGFVYLARKSETEAKFIERLDIISCCLDINSKLYLSIKDIANEKYSFNNFSLFKENKSVNELKISIGERYYNYLVLLKLDVDVFYPRHEKILKNILEVKNAYGFYQFLVSLNAVTIYCPLKMDIIRAIKSHEEGVGVF